MPSPSDLLECFTNSRLHEKHLRRETLQTQIPRDTATGLGLGGTRSGRNAHANRTPLTWMWRAVCWNSVISHRDKPVKEFLNFSFQHKRSHCPQTRLAKQQFLTDCCTLNRYFVQEYTFYFFLISTQQMLSEQSAQDCL